MTARVGDPVFPLPPRTWVDGVFESIWLPRVFLAAAAALWVGTLVSHDVGFLGCGVALAWLAHMLYEDRAAERRRSAPARARRRTRELEIDFYAAAGAENVLRRLLVADLIALERQCEAREELRRMLG